MSPSAAARFHAVLDPLVNELAPLHLALNEETWRASVTGLDEHVHESARLEAQIRTLLSDPARYEELLAIEREGGLADPLDRRQLTLSIHALRQHQLPRETIAEMVRLEKDLDRRFNNFRATLDGERVTNNRLRDVLKHSDDARARRTAWEASKQIGAEVRDELLERVDEAVAAGVGQGQIIIDPGLGFAKNAEHNWQLTSHLDVLVDLGFPVLFGASRKTYLGRLLADPDGNPRPVGEREAATLATSVLAVAAGAWGVRVHDVRGTADALAVWRASGAPHLSKR